jgi:hypothetical protein
MADPRSMPFTAARVDAVAPCAKKMAGVTVTFEGSLLVSVMKTPPDGAGCAKVTRYAAGWPGASVMAAGRMISDC